MPNGRRQEDAALQDALDTNRTIFRTLTRTGRIAGAVGSLSLLVGIGIGAVSAAVKMPAEIRKTTQQLTALDSTTNRRIDALQVQQVEYRTSHDSIRQILSKIDGELTLQRYTQCIIARRVAPDIRPEGCDAKGGAGGGTP